MQQPLVDDKVYAPFEEDQPPAYPDRPKTGLFGVYLSVKTQWNILIVFWVMFAAWLVAFFMDPFTGAMQEFVRNILPILMFFAFGIPTACSLIGYIPPNPALVMLVLILVGPGLFGIWKAAIPCFMGYMCCSIMSFMFMAIHHGKAATEDEDGSGKTDFILSLAQPMAISYWNALTYLWQFSSHCPLNYKLRWIIVAYKYAKEALDLVKAQATKTAKPYNPAEFRTYKLNDVQYIRIQSIRVMILMAMFSIVRIWEEKWCPTTPVTIDGGLFGWKWNYTKEIPVCEW